MRSYFKDLKGLKRRKRVAVDLNIKFVNIDSIKKAIGKVEKKEVYIKVKVKEIKLRPKKVSA